MSRIHWMLRLITALLVLAVAGGAFGGEVTPASASNATKYSGEACLIKVDLGLVDPDPLLDTLFPCATLPQTGGVEKEGLLEVGPTPVPGTDLTVSASVYGGHTHGQGNASHTHSSAASVTLTGVPGVGTIEATALHSRASAKCQDGVVLDGDSNIAILRIGDDTIEVGLEPNQVVFDEGGVTITANAQETSSRDGGEMQQDVTALRIKIAGVGTIDLVTAEANILCAGPPLCPVGNDFVTGGGWFTMVTNDKRHFANSGGYKNGGIWGHLVYMDKAAGVKVKGEPILYAASTPAMFQYETGGALLTAAELVRQVFPGVSFPVSDPSTTRYILGTLDNGFFYLVRASDNGEGAKAIGPDQFSIVFLSSSGGNYVHKLSFLPAPYAATSEPGGGVRGNVQLHKPRC